MINYIHIGMMVIYVLVITANIKGFMRCNYGKIYANTRMLMQKIYGLVWRWRIRLTIKLGEEM